MGHFFGTPCMFWGLQCLSLLPVGKFPYLSELPPRCPHLRQILDHLGLPSIPPHLWCLLPVQREGHWSSWESILVHLSHSPPSLWLYSSPLEVTVSLTWKSTTSHCFWPGSLTIPLVSALVDKLTSFISKQKTHFVVSIAIPTGPWISGGQMLSVMKSSPDSPSLVVLMYHHLFLCLIGQVL